MNGHVIVDILLNKLPKNTQNIINVSTRILAMVFFIFIALSLISMGLDHRASKQVTETLRIPQFYIFFILGGLFLVQAVQFLLDIIQIYGGGHEQ
jgi:TRAP-type C4-dicarboxylate transport system permease small subunit